MRVIASLLLMILGLLFASSALADNWKDCVSESTGLSIKGCSAIIDAGKDTTAKMAVAYYNRGNAYDSRGDLGRAIRDYDEAIALNPNYAEAYHDRAVVYDNKGDYDGAIKDYEKAIALNPKIEYARRDLAITYKNRGDAFLNKGDYELAIRDYNRAIKLNPQYVSALFNRADALEKKGEWKIAVDGWREVVANIPATNTSQAEAKTRLVTAEAMLARQKPTKAHEPLLKSILAVGTERSKLLFYDAACDDPDECEVADIGCDSDGNFTANLGGLVQKDITVWFASKNGTVWLIADTLLFDLQATEISYGEMNGDWWVKIPTIGESGRIWAALGTATDISLTIGKHVTVLPRTKDMDGIVKACVR